jgi:hypothetical protein
MHKTVSRHRQQKRPGSGRFTFLRDAFPMSIAFGTDFAFRRYMARFEPPNISK